MFHKKTLITLAVLGLILTAGVASTYAYRGNPDVQGPDYSPERHQAMLEVFENQDYAAWQELMQDRPIVDRISQEDFGKFVQIHQAVQAGDLEQAKELRQELGLGLGLKGQSAKGSGSGMMHRGARMGGNFADQNNDGICDNLDLN